MKGKKCKAQPLLRDSGAIIHIAREAIPPLITTSTHYLDIASERVSSQPLFVSFIGSSKERKTLRGPRGDGRRKVCVCVCVSAVLSPGAGLGGGDGGGGGGGGRGCGGAIN
jgi:hypothetical protein